jgi:hypothetical protein
MHYGDRFHRIWVLPLGVRVKNTAQQLTAYAVFGSTHTGIDSRDSGFASGHLGSKHCSAMNCINSFGSMHYRERFMGLRIHLWLSGEQILLGDELCMHILVNSLW